MAGAGAGRGSLTFVEFLLLVGVQQKSLEAASE